MRSMPLCSGPCTTGWKPHVYVTQTQTRTQSAQSRQQPLRGGQQRKLSRHKDFNTYLVLWHIFFYSYGLLAERGPRGLKPKMKLFISTLSPRPAARRTGRFES